MDSLSVTVGETFLGLGTVDKWPDRVQPHVVEADGSISRKRRTAQALVDVGRHWAGFEGTAV